MSCSVHLSPKAEMTISLASTCCIRSALGCVWPCSGFHLDPPRWSTSSSGRAERTRRTGSELLTLRWSSMSRCSSRLLSISILFSRDLWNAGASSPSICLGLCGVLTRRVLILSAFACSFFLLIFVPFRPCLMIIFANLMLLQWQLMRGTCSIAAHGGTKKANRLRPALGPILCFVLNCDYIN